MAQGQGDYAAARAHYLESLALGVAIGDKEAVAYNLSGLADLAIVLGVAERAARMAAATEALLKEIGGALAPDMRRTLDVAVAGAQALLGPPAFQAAWEAGERMNLDQAVRYAQEWQVAPVCPV